MEWYRWGFSSHAIETTGECDASRSLFILDDPAYGPAFNAVLAVYLFGVLLLPHGHRKYRANGECSCQSGRNVAHHVEERKAMLMAAWQVNIKLSSSLDPHTNISSSDWAFTNRRLHSSKMA